MKELIRHEDAARFLRGIQQPNGGIDLSEVRVEAFESTFRGTGSIRWKEDDYRIEWNLPDGPASEQFIQSMRHERGNPRTYTKSDRWNVRAVTRDGLNLEFRIFPPLKWTSSTGHPHRIDLRTCHLSIAKPERNAEEEQAFRDRLAGLGLHWNSEDEPEPPSSNALHHAVFPGVKSPLRYQRETSTNVKNDFLGEFEEKTGDTWISTREGMTFALVQRGEDLHAFVRFSDSSQIFPHQEDVFSAFLHAVGFTHGFRPRPMLREVSHGIVNAKCEIGSIEILRKSSAAPLSETLIVNYPKSETMLLVAFDFFMNKGQLSDQIRRLHGLLCEAHEGTLIRHSDILALCTIFEGTINSLFDHLSLKKGVNGSAAAKAFEQAKRSLLGWLETQQAGENAEEESVRGRMIGIVKSSSFIRTEEKLRAISAHYGFPWEGDVDEVFNMWKKQRNPIAHGSGQDESESSMKTMFASWSRMTGFINRLSLAEMGYVGCLSYSPMEENLVLKRIQPTSGQ